MPFDAQRFLKDHGITYWSPGKNVSVGWLGICCPLCGDHSNHGAFNLEVGNYSCWRCGPHDLTKVISRLLSVNLTESEEILRKYWSAKVAGQRGRQTRPLIRPKECLLPKGCGPLKKPHLDYLRRRGFNDPHELIRTWGLQGTGPLGPYKFRIIAPIYFDNQLVSYQGRDITGLSPLPYKACPKEKEVRDHKHCLYGIDLVEGRTVVVMEGVVDVWRFGPGAIATFGTEWTREQAKLLMERFDRVIIFYDGEEVAQQSATRLANQLTYSSLAAPIEVEFVELEWGDPGELTDEEIRKIRRQFLENKEKK